MTGLYDAVGKTINDVESELKKVKKSQRPDKILVAIVTDGGENASKEFTHSDIKKLIKKKECDDWQFVFLAADQDAFSVGTSFGVRGGNTFTYSNTSSGNAMMFDSLGYATKTFRSVAKTDANYSVVSASLFSGGDGDGDKEDISLVGTTGTFSTTASSKTDAKDEEGNS
jgi:hypothetical protein